MSAIDILKFLNASDFDLYCDHWNEQHLYFGKYGNQVQEIDKLFGSEKFKMPTDLEVLKNSAIMILKSPIDVATFNHKNFLKSWTDVIAIEKGLSMKMKNKWLLKV